MKNHNISAIDVAKDWAEQAPRLALFRHAKGLTDSIYNPPVNQKQPEYYNDKGEPVYVRDWHVATSDLPNPEELAGLGVEEVGIIHSPRLFHNNMTHAEAVIVTLQRNGGGIYPFAGLTMLKSLKGLSHIDSDFQGYRVDGSIDYRPALDSDIKEVTDILAAFERSVKS